ncbi:type VII secretion target [Nocardioides litoris]|uniref:type VII secretion target n=1 Tax=Nocardioides litoris TaxID=1926648 RepID=UPI00147720C1|nr:type VII secretion target [Nocardioides litoris]
MPTVDPTALRDLASRWTAVSDHVTRARAAVARTEDVSLTNFTALALSMAAVHVEAENYVQRELDAKDEDADGFAVRMRATADTWETTEAANTVSEGGS